MAKIYRSESPGSGSACDPIPEADGLRLTVDGSVLSMPYEGMRHRVGGYEDSWIIVEHDAVPGVELWLLPVEAVRFAGADGEVPPAHRGAFGGMTARHTEAGHKRTVKRGLYAAALVLVLAWMTAGGCTGLVVSAIPHELEEQLGVVLAEGIAEDLVVCDDEQLVGSVESILVRLVDAMDDPPYEFRVRVVREDVVNAFALPGGEIFFHTALLEKTESVDEVAAVMGHEVQHALQRHGLRSMARSAGLSIGLGLLLGDASEAVVALAGYAGNLTDLKFGRDQERESDEKGVALMARAGFDPQGAVAFFGMLAEESGDVGGVADRALAIVSTHPASTERTERLRELAAGLPSRRSVVADVDWKAIRGRCSAVPSSATPDSEPRGG